MRGHCEPSVPIISNDTPQRPDSQRSAKSCSCQGEDGEKEPLNPRELCLSRVAFHIPQNISLAFRWRRKQNRTEQIYGSLPVQGWVSVHIQSRAVKETKSSRWPERQHLLSLSLLWGSEGGVLSSQWWSEKVRMEKQTKPKKRKGLCPNPSSPLLNNFPAELWRHFLRFTVGTDKGTKQLLNQLAEFLQGASRGGPKSL